MQLVRSNINIKRIVGLATVVLLLIVAFMLGTANRSVATADIAKPTRPAVKIEASVFTAVGTQGANDLVNVIGKATGYWPSWEIPSPPGAPPLKRLLYVENPSDPASKKVLVINGDGRPPASSDDYLFDGSLTDQQLWGQMNPVSSITLAAPTTGPNNHQVIAGKLVEQFQAHGYKAKILDGEVVGIPSSLFHFVLVTDRIFPSRLIIVRSPEADFPPGFFQPWTRPPSIPTSPS